MQKKTLGCLMILTLCACSSSEVSKEDVCHKQAENRLELYQKPIYPINDAEKVSASNALYDECMRDNNYQREVDTKNALPPVVEASPPPPPAPVAPTVQNLPPIIAAKNKPVLVPIGSLEPQPYVPSDKELENILIRN